MYWLDGSSELPYTPKSSYLLSKTRTRAIALAQDLIENQARIVKSCVKYNNFHHWCTVLEFESCHPTQSRWTCDVYLYLYRFIPIRSLVYVLVL